MIDLKSYTHTHTSHWLNERMENDELIASGWKSKLKCSQMLSKSSTHGRLNWPPKSDVINQWAVRRVDATQKDDGSEVTSQKSKHKTNTHRPPTR